MVQNQPRKKDSGPVGQGQNGGQYAEKPLASHTGIIVTTPQDAARSLNERISRERGETLGRWYVSEAMTEDEFATWKRLPDPTAVYRIRHTPHGGTVAELHAQPGASYEELSGEPELETLGRILLRGARFSAGGTGLHWDVRVDDTDETALAEAVNEAPDVHEVAATIDAFRAGELTLSKSREALITGSEAVREHLSGKTLFGARPIPEATYAAIDEFLSSPNAMTWDDARDKSISGMVTLWQAALAGGYETTTGARTQPMPDWTTEPIPEGAVMQPPTRRQVLDGIPIVLAEQERRLAEYKATRTIDEELEDMIGGRD